MKTLKMTKVEKLEKQLAEVCEQIYLENVKGRRIIPRHPYIIVRVLPKEHKTASGLYLPGNVQNKPVYEAIVVEVWRPYVETRQMKYRGENIDYTVKRTSELKVGDRILFPHFEGHPLSSYLDEKYYRVIREGNVQQDNPWCSVYGKLDYDGDVSLVQKLKPLMEKFTSVTMSGSQNPNAPHWEPPSKSDMFTS